VSKADARPESLMNAPERSALVLVEELPRLQAYVRLRMGAELRACESARDIVQSVCIELLEREKSLEWRGRESFRYWLFVTALNKVKQRLRHHRVRRRGALRWSEVDKLALSGCYASVTPLQAVQTQEGIEQLEAAFDTLPSHYADIITLRRIVGVPYATLAAERGVTEASLRLLLRRALARLSTLLDAHDGS
jgi:RNA polymerase sigma factor (sigma-70 family)